MIANRDAGPPQTSHTLQNRGNIDHVALKEYVTKGSLQLMTDEDVECWISCLREDTEGTVSKQRFLEVFVAMTKKMNSEEFKHMVVDLST
jgi:hypothetical protein